MTKPPIPMPLALGVADLVLGYRGRRVLDGVTYINAGTASPGEIVRVRVTQAADYDLIGGIVRARRGLVPLMRGRSMDTSVQPR